MDNITIVGGGTSGWLTALYIRQLFPESNISLIKSTDVGILGAGEGSVPMLPTILSALKIDENELLNEVKGTFKMGISFENWKGDGEKYIHGFDSIEVGMNVSVVTNKNPISIGLPSTGIPFYLLNLIHQNQSWENRESTTTMCYNNKSPYFMFNGKIKQSVGYSYHFDARLMADFLEKKGKSRGIKVLDTKIKDFITNESGDVVECLTEEGLKIKTDFIFDCSGFHRLLIGKHYKTNWVSYEKHLKVNSAIPFFLEQSTEEITPYTHAVAMKYGWMWKIPLQHRYGCGYIFDKNYISSDEAKKEVEEMLGHEITVPKVIEFSAGRYEKVWVNNCISIGLSSGFTEPIEATSIWIQIMQLTSLTKDMLLNKQEFLVNEYNDRVAHINDEILSFLYFHYVNERKDTPFWEDYLKTTEVPESLKSKLSSWEHRLINDSDKNNDSGLNLFSTQSWLTVQHGNGVLKRDILDREMSTMNVNQKINAFNKNVENNIKTVLNTSIGHMDYLNKIKKSNSLI
jgi:tryptophan halogenase